MDSTQAQDQPLQFNTLDGIIARLAAEDNIPFSTIALSPAIRRLVLKFTGENVPLSANTIMRKTMNEAAVARAEMRRYLESNQPSGACFSIVIDEATPKNSPLRFISRADPGPRSHARAGDVL